MTSFVARSSKGEVGDKVNKEEGVGPTVRAIVSIPG